MIVVSIPALGQQAESIRRQAARLLEKAQEMKTRNPSQAILYTDSLEALVVTLPEQDYLYEAFKTRGDIYNLVGKYEDAITCFYRASEIAESQQDSLRMVKIYNNLGGVYHNTGIFEKALEKYFQALQVGELALTSSQKATVLSNIGLLYDKLEEYAEAHLYYQKALALIEKNEDDPPLPFIHVNLGALYSKQKLKEKALNHLKMARAIYEKQKDEAGIAVILCELGNLFVEDKPEASLEYFGLAQQMFEKQQNKRGLFYNTKSIGYAYFRLTKFNIALTHFNKALELADSLQNREVKGDVLLKIAKLYEAQQLYEQAGKYYKDYIKNEKEKDKKELLNSIAISRIDFEVSQKEKKIKLLEQQAKQAYTLIRSRNLIISIMVGLVVMVIFLVFFYVNKSRNLHKLNIAWMARNKLIQSQKTEILEQNTLIQKKQVELEEARRVSEGYFAELLLIKEELEEKVKVRTREFEYTYKKLAFHINNTPLAVLEWNSKLELTQWPQQAVNIFGYTADEVLGLKISEMPFVAEDERQELEAIILDLCLGQQVPQYFTQRNTDRHGNALYIEWNYSIFMDEKGNLESILTIANDITVREKAFKELKGANEELDTFLYKSSHDLRGPLARMQGIINLGLLESPDPQSHIYFNMLKKVTEEMNTLLLRLMSVHNISQHKLKPEEVCFSYFVDQTISELGIFIQAGRNIKFINNVPVDFYLYSDSSLLRVILVNLLENAIRFADNFQSKIEVEAFYLPSGKYIIKVSDNGMGIPAEYHEKIFELFFQGSTRSTGTGLGLYMVKKAVKKLGGEIKLQSKCGQTVFEVLLPTSKNQIQAAVNVLEG